jgi:hypothetical protein
VAGDGCSILAYAIGESEPVGNARHEAFPCLRPRLYDSGPKEKAGEGRPGSIMTMRLLLAAAWRAAA